MSLFVQARGALRKELTRYGRSGHVWRRPRGHSTYNGRGRLRGILNISERPAELGEVGPGAEPYPPDARWAKPDLDAGADAMRHLYDHPDVARELGRRARASVTATPDATAAAAPFGERFVALTGAGAEQ